VKRALLITCCTFVSVLGSLAVAAPAVADCPYGTVARFNGVCTGGQGGAPPPPGVTVPQQGAEVFTSPGSFPTINGIPCNERHASTCYALQQNAN
jgi:hypothetical protein